MSKNVYVDDEKVLKRLQSINDLDLYKSMMASVSLMYQTASDELSSGFNHSKGDLKNKLNYDVRYNGNGEIIGELSNSSDHAIFVEFGTGTKGNGTYPYSPSETGINLTYTDKPYWRYKDADGNWYTTKGQVAHPFMFPAYKKNERKIKELIQQDVHLTMSGNKYVSKSKGGK